MDLAFDAAQVAFRDEVRAFVDGVLGARDADPDGADDAAWEAALIARGWQAYKWAPEHGGPGWDTTQRFIWETEVGLRGLPTQLGGAGISMLGPILYTWGTAEQRARFLGPILDGSHRWCQGYSEPGAGSDLAGLGTKAVRDGDAYVVDGQKIWTSGAHKCNWMFAIVRTRPDGKPQAGISFLLLAMDSPGVTVRPIISIDGDHTLNAVHLDGVRVPVDQRVGDEHGGWSVAKGLLSHERTGLAFVTRSRQVLAALRRQAQATGLGADPAFAAKLAAAEVDLDAIATTELRVLAETATGQAPGDAASILKLRGTAVLQHLTELTIEHAAWAGVPYPLDAHKPAADRPGPAWAARDMALYLIGRSASIAGGSDEVQRNVIARHVLGL